MIGGGGEKKTLRMVAEHADIWHGFGDADTMAHKNRVLDDWCAQLGRDPGEIERSTAVRTGPEAAAALLATGERLFTLDTDGRAGFDLSLTRDWVQFRDEQNAGLPS